MQDRIKDWMHIFSRPRANGSRVLEETLESVVLRLKHMGIPYEIHRFRLYDQFFALIGLWIIFSRSLLVVALWLHWGWVTLLIACVGLIGGLADILLNFPTIVRLKSSPGKNLLIHFAPPSPRQEVILCAHYDSKTELLDHYQRMFFIKRLPFGIALTLLCGFWGMVDGYLIQTSAPWTVLSQVIGALLSAPLLFLSWGLGLNLTCGFLRTPSQGAVDNGAACAVLLLLAEHLKTQGFDLSNTSVTLALFSGEEVNMQGSQAYVHERNWKLPSAALNMEIMAQDGDYVYWERDGNSLKLVPSSAWLNQCVSQSIQSVHGSPPRPRPIINSDGASFLFAGIPCTTIGTLDQKMEDRGFHHASDNLARVKAERIEEGMQILIHFLKQIDTELSIVEHSDKGGEKL